MVNEGSAVERTQKCAQRVKDHAHHVIEAGGALFDSGEVSTAFARADFPSKADTERRVIELIDQRGGFAQFFGGIVSEGPSLVPVNITGTRGRADSRG